MNLAGNTALVSAGIGNAVRLVNRDGSAGSLEDYTRVINVNLIGSFNVLRLTAASMTKNDEDEGGERGACVLTASIAAFEGQIGQISYSASKGGVVGMTIVAARDLARAHIRVCTIAPGIMGVGQSHGGLREHHRYQGGDGRGRCGPRRTGSRRPTPQSGRNRPWRSDGHTR